MSDPKVIAALIAGAATILAAVVGIVGKLILAGLTRLLTRIEAVEHEVKPNRGHSSHDKVMASLSDLSTQVGGVRDDVRTDREANSREHYELRKADSDLHRRISDLHPPGGGTGTSTPLKEGTHHDDR